jgi:chloride channel protein, CIC family
MSREYSIDPLEITFTREVMRTDIVALPKNLSLNELSKLMPTDLGQRVQHLFPVEDENDHFVGVVTRRAMRTALQEEARRPTDRRVADITRYDVKVAYADEPLRVIVERMAATGLTRFPVVDREDPTRLVGSISLNNLLAARVIQHEAETRREQVLSIPRINGREVDSESA